MAESYADRSAQMFPRLSPEQIARLASQGRRRQVGRGEIVVEQGAASPDFFVVISGEVEIVEPRDGEERRLILLTHGQFTGEISLVAGRRNLLRIRACMDGELLAIPPDALRRIVQTDADLSELFVRAFLLRRAALISAGQGDTVLVGSIHSAATLRVREFLSRNGQPYAYVDVDVDPAAQELLDRFGVRAGDIPVLICRSERVLKNPSNEEIAECLGFNRELDPAAVRDVVVVGAGPAGLAAAVYGASEGLDVLVLEGNAPGGQAGSSSRIENYLGFPTGISGQALAARAYTQAEKFGAEIAIARPAARLDCEHRPYAVELSDGASVKARAIVIATGVQYRKPDCAECARFEGVGVYYAATPIEAQLCRGHDVAIVGGGNSAGQAAVFLASHARSVRVLVRGAGLSETMSRYLISRIEETPNVTVHAYHQIVGVDGERHLERVQVRDGRSGDTRTLPVRHLFMMTGADPNTRWLQGCVALDDKGFVRTGGDLRPGDLSAWPLSRAPHALETSAPGVFAVGDVRAGSMKRVASAVGEGSACIQLVHRVLAE